MKNSMFVLVFVLIANFGFSQTGDKAAGVKTYDPKLVGNWKGSEKDQQQKGLTKYWVSVRSAEGISTLLFISIDQDGEVTQFTENGKWWVENGQYHELHEFDGIVDVFDYQVIEDSVRFKSVEMLGRKDGSYSFEDYRIGVE